MFEIILAVIVAVVILLLYSSNVLVYISNEKIGIVEKNGQPVVLSSTDLLH